MLIFSFAPSFFVRLVNVVTKISPIRSVVALVIHPSALQFQVHCSRAFFIAMDHKCYTRFSLTPPISFLLMGGSSRSPWFFPSPVSSHSFPPACVRSSSLFGNFSTVFVRLKSLSVSPIHLNKLISTTFAGVDHHSIRSPYLFGWNRLLPLGNQASLLHAKMKTGRLKFLCLCTVRW